jgi:hypothetical protein
MRALPALLLLIAIPAHASAATVARSDVLGCLGSGGACLKPTKAEAYSQDGKVVGWKLTQVKGLLSRLGFKENDVLVSANGEDVTDRGRLGHWALELLRIHDLKLGILRKGQAKNLAVKITD